MDETKATSSNLVAAPKKKKKRTRSQSPADRLLKLKRGLDELAPLVSNDPKTAALAAKLGALRDETFDMYIDLERKRGHSG